MIRPTIGILPAFDPLGGRWVSGVRLLYVPWEYLDALKDAGAQAVVLPPVVGVSQALSYLAMVDGVLLIGGTTPLSEEIITQDALPELRDLNAERYLSETLYIEAAYQKKMPLMGVCRGMQVLNEVLGGSTDRRRLGRPGTMGHYQETPGDEPVHAVTFAADSRMVAAVGKNTVLVNSFHREAVSRPGAGLRIVAYSPDGIAEAIESDTPQCVFGVQFHPELLRVDHPSRGLYTAWVEAARTWQDQKRKHGSEG